MTRAIATALVVASGLLVPALNNAQVPRRIDGVWTSIGSRYSDADGRFLGMPQKIVACGAYLVSLDLDGNYVAAFDRNLRPLWRFGREGGGPGELRMPSDVACDARGTVWILDPANSRILKVGPSGTLQSTVMLSESATRLTVSPDGSRLFASGTRDLVQVMDSLGRILSRLGHPDPLKDLTLVQRESRMVSLGSSGLVVGFRWSSTLVLIPDVAASPHLLEGIEPVPFPQVRSYPAGRPGATMVRIDPAAREVTSGLFLLGDTLGVLVAPREEGPRLVDRYLLPTGRYLGSWRVPAAVVSVAWMSGSLYALSNEPVPQLARLQRER
jgi:hypothetical protein